MQKAGRGGQTRQEGSVCPLCFQNVYPRTGVRIGAQEHWTLVRAAGFAGEWGQLSGKINNGI